MGTPLSTKSSSSLLIRRLLSSFSLEWVAALFELLHHMRQVLSHKHPDGMYEILDYDSTLELKDVKGNAAIFKRHQKVRFLQDHVIAFQDHAWGSGDIFADYKTSKGLAVDRYQEGDRWNVLISLRETKSKNDIEDFYIERTVKNGFTEQEEWRQVEVWYKTHRLRLTVIFPKGRHCRRAVLHTRANNRTIVLGHEHFQLLPDRRQMLRWEAKHPRQAEVYTIRWKW